MAVKAEIEVAFSAGTVLLERMAAIHQKAFAKLDQKGWTADTIATVLEGPGGFVVVAKRSGVIEGFALFRQIADEAELITFAVDPDYQRLGIAYQILEAACDHLTAQVCISIFLEVRSDNEAAIALYQRHGFANSGVRKGYYKTENGVRVDALTFSKHLT